MIERDEIEAVAKSLGVHTSHVQRDYVHGWLLASFFSESPLARSLVLKGGNALRKCYFEGARYSRDLDFSTPGSVSHDVLARQLNSACQLVEAHTGVRFDRDRTNVRQKESADKNLQVTEAKLFFRDFYGSENEIVLGVRMDVTEFDKLRLPVQERELLHPYTDIADCAATIRVAKLEEIVAAKMRCLLQRRHIADLFDLAASTLFAEPDEINQGEVLRTFFQMTVFRASPGVAKGLLSDLPFDALGALWERYISCPRHTWFSFDTAKEALLGLVAKLFPGRAEQDRSQILFPSALRKPIMRAAETMTMLELRYDGRTRLVEPYSLAFKTRRDGVGREYLYVYDTTGGRSGPGIKSLVPGNVEAIANAEKKFEPRYEVELRKAGGSELAKHFGGNRVSRFGRAASVASFEVQCYFCDRVFRRSKFSTKLRPHKDKDGVPCSARVGYAI